MLDQANKTDNQKTQNGKFAHRVHDAPVANELCAVYEELKSGRNWLDEWGCGVDQGSTLESSITFAIKAIKAITTS